MQQDENKRVRGEICINSRARDWPDMQAALDIYEKLREIKKMNSTTFSFSTTSAFSASLRRYSSNFFSLVFLNIFLEREAENALAVEREAEKALAVEKKKRQNWREKP